MIPEYFENNIVTDCKSVEEFANKYRKPERFTGRGAEYVKAIMESHYEDLEKYGYTSISRHDNITGKAIYFIKSN